MRKTIAAIVLLTLAGSAIAQTKDVTRRGARINDRSGARIERSRTQKRGVSFVDPEGKARETARDTTVTTTTRTARPSAPRR